MVWRREDKDYSDYPTDRIRVIGSRRRARSPRNLRDKGTRVAICPYCPGTHPANKDCAGTGVETNWT